MAKDVCHAAAWRADVTWRAGALLLWIASSQALLAMTAGSATAQTRRQVDNAVRFGAIAADTPLCGLRDLRWAADLQRAELRAMGVDPNATDPAQHRLSERAQAALSYAQGEAFDSFADAPPEATCGKLVLSPDLAQADEMVDAYRAGADQPLW